MLDWGRKGKEVEVGDTSWTYIVFRVDAGSARSVNHGVVTNGVGRKLPSLRLLKL